MWKLDRLGRSLKELVTMIDGLHQRKIGFNVFAGHGAQIDTNTSNGRPVFGLFVALAEFERELIVERANAGLAAARARGRMGGRPRKVDAAILRMALAAMSDPNSIAIEVVKRLNITTATLYTYVNSDGSLKAAGIKLLETKKIM